MDQRVSASLHSPAPERPEVKTQGRDLRLDLFRGIALWFILLDHIPNNVFAWATLRNYGFSDTTEIFFFVSGYTCALAYGRAQREQGWAVAITRILRRTLEIYAAFLLLVIMFLAIIFALTALDKQALDETNTAVFFANPGPALSHLATLTYMPVNTDVLASFALLHALFVPILMMLTRAPNATLVLSIAIYVLVRAVDINIPTWPPKDDGFWAFNPFAFQVLFVFGAWIAFGGARIATRIAASRFTIVMAIAWLVISAVLVVGWHAESLKVDLPDAITRVVYPVDKQGLHPLRLLHFLALTVIALRFVPLDWRRLASWPARAAIWCGENSLAVYALGVILAFIAGETLRRFSATLPLEALLSVGGLTISILAAYGLTRAAQLDAHEPKLL